MIDTGTLQATTPSDTEVQLVRAFHAPREMVYRAITEPELVRKWLHGPPKWTMEVCGIDLREGGSFRYEWHSPDGEIMGMGGVFQEIHPNERLVHTELFDEDWTGGETLVTTLLKEEDGQTTLTLRIRYQSQEARDKALQTGMIEGVSMSYDRMARLVTEG
jgi:uncharacterized protein YndB with AHSA1/START domain